MEAAGSIAVPRRTGPRALTRPGKPSKGGSYRPGARLRAGCRPGQRHLRQILTITCRSRLLCTMPLTSVISCSPPVSVAQVAISASLVLRVTAVIRIDRREKVFVSLWHMPENVPQKSFIH